ncbi:MAG: right-handed parallel beta-helix repeat-containing protein [Bdellovibrionaceae bacterium]|nr:right-handed parallel beta-helix repeat-containing protein [Pseudobdellovibrionaceae bacterium]
MFDTSPNETLPAVPPFIQEKFGPFGPEPHDYPVPAVAIYCAPDGLEANSGDTVENPTTLEEAVRRATTGATVVLRGGSYRTGNIVFEKHHDSALPKRAAGPQGQPCRRSMGKIGRSLENELEDPVLEKPGRALRHHEIFRGRAASVEQGFGSCRRITVLARALCGGPGPGQIFCGLREGRDPPWGESRRQNRRDHGLRERVSQGTHGSGIRRGLSGRGPRRPDHPRAGVHAISRGDGGSAGQGCSRPHRTGRGTCRAGGDETAEQPLFISGSCACRLNGTPNSLIAKNEIAHANHTGMVIYMAHHSVFEHNLVSHCNPNGLGNFPAGIKLLNQSLGFIARNNYFHGNKGNALGMTSAIARDS